MTKIVMIWSRTYELLFCLRFSDCQSEACWAISMSKKVSIELKKGEPHDPASSAGIACQVANIWLRRSDPWQTLQAIEPDTKYASVASLG